MECRELLKKLCSINAVTGREDVAAQAISDILSPYCDEVKIDAFFNVIGLKKGQGENPRNVLVTAHYDQIGLVVTGIDENGFLRFSAMGGVDPKILGAQEVTVHGRRDLHGVIGTKPPHLISPEDADKPVKLEDMRIDIGYGAEQARELVSVGDVITFKFPAIELKNNRMAGRSMDNRSSVAALVEILKELKRIRHDDNVYVAATVQEESGLVGAFMASWHIRPDLAIAIDVCHGDMPDAPSDESFPLGKGVAIAVGPILSREHTRACIGLAKRERIPYQIDAEEKDTGTEAAVYSSALEGIPTLLLSIPAKYMHTTVEMVSLDDIGATARLAARYIAFRDELLQEGDSQ
ncbi:MAG TPA: M20/M25/M40 family metallo-hydrolase [Thermoclostridium caenicola]|uniref:M20/M25/M40 family metallo-hydrolase n=1 Tax=Thermoclostridium caenicola TaxID=659425 RepID=UPI002CF08898|nr:M20/M25/M40 family metallo-hydrolase [Thermoclostridium caenicola]HOL83750.1 M20/M25/M40 family metallo-hydrolase [Thermoclostridium caenicola]HPO76699.1 M20/M25/M40 family metallo-hydrolase [Thermoclostridium caenicola]